MRVLTIAALAVAVGAANLNAQGHGHQLEIGGFGTYTGYDATYTLDNQFGGGAVLGYFLSDYFGLEASFDMASPTGVNGGVAFGTRLQRFSGSLVLNSGGEKNILYVLGGYTRAKWGGTDPFVNLNEIHGGIGDRIFLNHRMALRLEARAYYSFDNYLGGAKPLDFTGSAGLSFYLFGKGTGGSHEPEAAELPKETRDSIIAAGGTVPPPAPTKEKLVTKNTGWRQQWFWGAQGGVLAFNTDYDGFSAEPMFGGHWLVTAKKTALYVGYEHSFFLSDRHATITHPDGTLEPGNVAFKELRRIIGGVLAYPVQKPVQPFGGLGFMIVQILNPVATCTNCTATDAQLVQIAAEDASSQAFFFWMAGLEARQGRMTIYGHYMITSPGHNFLINGVTHTVQGGLRYTFGSSREGVGER
jgi:hypothetical protein